MGTCDVDVTVMEMCDCGWRHVVVIMELCEGYVVVWRYVI